MEALTNCIMYIHKNSTNIEFFIPHTRATSTLAFVPSSQITLIKTDEKRSAEKNCDKYSSEKTKKCIKNNFEFSIFVQTLIFVARFRISY